jgi:N-carbamoylputrescine amidase
MKGQETAAVGVIQMAMAGNPEENMRKAADRVRRAAKDGARIVLLPELYRSPYPCQSEDPARFDLAEQVDGPSFALFSGLAAELRLVIVVPIFEKRAPGLYHNSALIIDRDGRRVGLYRKMHIPDDPGYYEKFYFTPGDLGFPAFDTAYGRIGALICWDQWYPEGARLSALDGASALLYPTAIGWHPAEKARHGEAQLDSWLTVQRGHAIANGVYLAAANRVGTERPDPDRPGIEFWGNSFICDPQGAMLARASAEREEILCAEIDTVRLEEIRRNWPFLRDRRIDAYQAITKRFRD